jgi:hypothetical protein
LRVVLLMDFFKISFFNLYHVDLVSELLLCYYCATGNFRLLLSTTSSSIRLDTLDLSILSLNQECSGTTPGGYFLPDDKWTP